jgi:hypothetical protein
MFSYREVPLAMPRFARAITFSRELVKRFQAPERELISCSGARSFAWCAVITMPSRIASSASCSGGMSSTCPFFRATRAFWVSMFVFSGAVKPGTRSATFWRHMASKWLSAASSRAGVPGSRRRVPRTRAL